MVADQRPLSIGEILDQTAAVYRKHFLALVSITAPPAAVMIAIVGIFALLFVTRLPAINTDATAGVQVVLLGLVLVLVGLPLFLCVTAVSLGASNHAVLCAHRGQPITIRGSYTWAFSRFGRLLWLLVVQGLIAFVLPYIVFIVLAIAAGAIAALLAPGLKGPLGVALAILAVLAILALIVLCFWLWIRMSLASPVVVAEDKPAWDSVKRSDALTKGSRGRTFLMFLLVWILVFAVSMVLIFPVDIGVTIFFRKAIVGGQPPTSFAIALQVCNLAVDFAVRTLVMPIYAISLMLFYFDQRTRLEGYDLELLMARAGWGTAAPSPVETPANPATPSSEPITPTPGPPTQESEWPSPSSE
jgi:hypothetical protein